MKLIEIQLVINNLHFNPFHFNYMYYKSFGSFEVFFDLAEKWIEIINERVQNNMTYLVYINKHFV